MLYCQRDGRLLFFISCKKYIKDWTETKERERDKVVSARRFCVIKRTPPNYYYHRTAHNCRAPDGVSLLFLPTPPSVISFHFSIFKRAHTKSTAVYMCVPYSTIHTHTQKAREYKKGRITWKQNNRRSRFICPAILLKRFSSSLGGVSFFLFRHFAVNSVGALSSSTSSQAWLFYASHGRKTKAIQRYYFVTSSNKKMWKTIAPPFYFFTE